MPKVKNYAIPMIIGLLLLVGGTALAVDVFFAGRGVRSTKIAASTCQADGGNTYNCMWFDTSNRERFWNGTTSLYTTNSTEGSPDKGKILIGTGTNWVSLAAGTKGQVLMAYPTDMGGPTGVKWKSPQDGGYVTP